MVRCYMHYGLYMSIVNEYRFIAGNQPKTELPLDLGDMADAAPKSENNIMN